MPGESGGPVVTCSCAFYTLHARLRVQRASGIPHALFPREWIVQNSGASRRENADVCLNVIARSEATKQSIFTIVPAMDCFAPLAMTVSKRSRQIYARHRPPPGRRNAPPDDRLQRAIQYSRDADDGIERPRRTGYPARACQSV